LRYNKYSVFYSRRAPRVTGSANLG